MSQRNPENFVDPSEFPGGSVQAEESEASEFVDPSEMPGFVDPSEMPGFVDPSEFPGGSEG